MKRVTVEIPSNRRTELLRLVSASGYAKIVSLRALVDELQTAPTQPTSLTDEQIEYLIQSEIKAHRAAKTYPGTAKQVLKK